MVLLLVLAGISEAALAQNNPPDSIPLPAFLRKRNDIRAEKRLDKERKIAAAEENMRRKAAGIVAPSMRFKNINKPSIPYYVNERDLARILTAHKGEDNEKLYRLLYNYVSNFGIKNFINDIGLLYDLASLSAFMGNHKLSSELYALIIKHYRGTKEVPKWVYDSLVQPSTAYLNLAEYKKFVQELELVDSLKPEVDSIDINMGEEINSKYEDYGLSMAQDDSSIVFTSQRNKHPSDPELKNEDIFFTKKDEYGYWEAAKQIPGLNTQYNEGSPCLSPDGKTLVFARCFSPAGYGNCDLFISEYSEDSASWSEPRNLGPYINSTAWDSHPTFSTNGDTLFFASDRLSGFGGSDIYFSRKGRGQIWLPCENLGPVVNTRNDEVSPYYHTLRRVLYFSSSGQLVSFGGFDIYKTYSIDSTWSEPVNVGPFINTPSDEYYFAINGDAKIIFYAQSDTNRSDLDLFSFPLPMEAHPDATVKFSGSLREERTGEIFTGTVAIFDLEERRMIAPKRTSADGSFEFNLINKRKYLLVVDGENFFRLEQVFFLDGPQKKDIQLKNIQTVQFKSVEFELGSSRLSPQMENDLHLVIKFLTEHPDFELSIEGHTDTSGYADANKKLSQERADVIKEYIVSYGKFENDRIKAIGYGEERPLVRELTEMDRKTNRRVEFRLFNRPPLESEKAIPEKVTDPDAPLEAPREEDFKEDKDDFGGG